MSVLGYRKQWDPEFNPAPARDKPVMARIWAPPEMKCKPGDHLKVDGVECFIRDVDGEYIVVIPLGRSRKELREARRKVMR